MKVLLPYNLDPLQIYLREFVSGFKLNGCETFIGWKTFFERSEHVDIVSVHWPEPFILGYAYGIRAEEGCALFIERLQWWKDSGARIVWTIHNEIPHRFRNLPLARQLYQRVADLTDVAVHHCDESIRIMQRRYFFPKSTAHVTIPHGHYFAYPNRMDRKTARRTLGIDEDVKVLCNFGTLERRKRLDLVYRAFLRLSVQGRKRLVFAGKASPRIKSALKLLSKIDRRVLLFEGPVKNDDIQLFMNAADAVVIGAGALNSGVAVLGMTFGKPVVAPATGCLREVLAQGANQTYEPWKVHDFARAMSDALGMDPKRVHEINMTAARKWEWERVAKTILDVAMVR